MRSSKQLTSLPHQFTDRLDHFRCQLSRYLQSQDADTIHDFRTSFRRLQATYSIYPPVARSNAAVEYLQLARQLFKLNSLIRDCDIMLVDDYGHHPREIAATLEAVRAGWPDRRLVLAFQPHRYSRTHDAFEDFVAVLSKVDVLVLAEVYAAGEAPIAGADGRALVRSIRARGQVDPVFLDVVEDLPQILGDLVADGDIVVTMGAGNIGAVAAAMAEAMCP